MSYMKHNEDDGDLSIFASDDEILIACNQGHVWFIKSARQELSESSIMAGHDTTNKIVARYGEAVLSALQADAS
ncbi:hypothetical protein BJQ94_13840 [Cryobacterium sp. SO2]|uniref:hypothetical protein n=1 Tax=Cryobacterium sp. SO2 TaxID=1897060 RepID=UPI00223D2026|nr:hypothetical protein [Cryobacterium sp. SO2]WEO76440.1 hypothetical protein BJQ94_13840 [Cryobacterium sp. SO2]